MNIVHHCPLPSSVSLWALPHYFKCIVDCFIVSAGMLPKSLEVTSNKPRVKFLVWPNEYCRQSKQHYIQDKWRLHVSSKSISVSASTDYFKMAHPCCVIKYKLMLQCVNTTLYWGRSKASCFWLKMVILYQARWGCWIDEWDLDYPWLL